MEPKVFSQIMNEIGRNTAEDMQTALREGKERLSYNGIEVGALVRRNRDGRIYQITRISDTPSILCGFFLMGLQRKKDGGWGSHEHSPRR